MSIERNDSLLANDLSPTPFEIFPKNHPFLKVGPSLRHRLEIIHLSTFDIDSEMSEIFDIHFVLQIFFTFCCVLS